MKELDKSKDNKKAAEASGVEAICLLQLFFERISVKLMIVDVFFD